MAQERPDGGFVEVNDAVLTARGFDRTDVDRGIIGIRRWRLAVANADRIVAWIRRTVVGPGVLPTGLGVAAKDRTCSI